MQHACYKWSWATCSEVHKVHFFLCGSAFLIANGGCAKCLDHTTHYVKAYGGMKVHLC